MEKPAFEFVKAKVVTLKHQPRPVGSIKLTAEEGYRLRVGDYRVLHRIGDKVKTVYIYRVKHRREAYR